MQNTIQCSKYTADQVAKVLLKAIRDTWNEKAQREKLADLEDTLQTGYMALFNEKGELLDERDTPQMALLAELGTALLGAQEQ